MGKRISQFTNTFLSVFIGSVVINTSWNILAWTWQLILRNDAIGYWYGFFESLNWGLRIGLFVAIIRVILGFLSDLLSD